MRLMRKSICYSKQFFNALKKVGLSHFSRKNFRELSDLVFRLVHVQCLNQAKGVIKQYCVIKLTFKIAGATELGPLAEK